VYEWFHILDKFTGQLWALLKKYAFSNTAQICLRVPTYFRHFQTTSEHENQYLNSNLGLKHVGLQPIWVSYNISLIWIKAIWGWLTLLTMIPVRSQWGRYNLPRPMQVVHFRCTIDYPGIASWCQLFTSSRPYLWRASYTDVGQGTLTPFKLAWLQSVNHQDITRNNWNDVVSPKQEQVHHNMFLMDVQLWLPASKLMYVNFHCIQHHQFGGASACRRTWRCPPSHP
jgi:hypothetical protein